MTATSLHPAGEPTSRRGLSPAHRLSLAGLAAIGISFGFARYAYGLFLPQIRAEFDLRVSVVGLIGSATYVGYLTALVLVGAFVTRFGPRVMIVIGGASATIGMTMVGLASGTGVLVAGLILAGTSPGWMWAPYSDAAARTLPPERQRRVLAFIPSGTAFGVVIAGPLALLAQGSAWQQAWLVFAAGALLATAYNARVLPAGPAAPAGPKRRSRLGVRWFARRAAVPLYVTALSYGVVGSVYWLLAVEAVSSAAGTGGHVPGLFWTVIGAAGTMGVFAGTLFDRLGLRRSHQLLFTSLAVAVALLGTMAGTIAAVGLSAVLYGPAFMAVSALLAVWSHEIFPERPATGFSATVFFLGLGTIAGPVTVGSLADRFGLATAFLATAAMALVTTRLRPPARQAASEDRATGRSR